MSNRSVGPLLEKLSMTYDLSAQLYPQEIITFHSPESQVPEKLQNLQARSPLEIFLLSIQSIASLPSFVAYTIAGAVLAWISFFTNSVYLLIAAMLIAPFAGPAMNVALATATGDGKLLRKSLIRYAVAIPVTMGVTSALSFFFQQTFITDLMTGVGHVSTAAALLPLLAGAAGAFNITQSDRSSLVSGTAVGTLVTASLAPPAALLGVAATMQEWNLFINATFQLVLQLIGINLAGALTFRYQGLNLKLSRYGQGNRTIFVVSLVLTVLALGGMLTWQLTDPLRLERRSINTQAAEVIQTVLQENEHVRPVSIEASFKESKANGSNVLVANVYVLRLREAGSNPDFEKQLQMNIQQALQENNPQIMPLVEVIVLEPPPNTPIPKDNNQK
jgi:uncharacterized membrane protein